VQSNLTEPDVGAVLCLLGCLQPSVDRKKHRGHFEGIFIARKHEGGYESQPAQESLNGKADELTQKNIQTNG
jgi:hypothetical protein